MKKTEKLYLGFREYVIPERLDEYDEEFHSRMRHGYKFMIPFIKRYVDFEKELKTLNSREKEKLFAYFLNVYCDQYKALSKNLATTKNIPRNGDQDFLFK